MYLLADLYKILEFKVPDMSDWDSFVALILLRYNQLHDGIIAQFGTNGIYILSLFCGFLCLIAMIYIKSIIETLQNPINGFYSSSYFSNSARQQAQNKTKAEEKEEEFVDDYGRKRPKAIRHPDWKEKRQESRITTASLLKSNRQQIDKDRATSLDIIRAAEAEVSATRQQKDQQIAEAEEQKRMAEQKTEKVLTETQQQNAFMITLLLNLLSRGVSEAKSAQVLYMQDQQNRTPEDIIQIVKSVRDFIGLCKADAFKHIPNHEKMPSGYEALNALANGDNSLCLTLLKNLTRKCLDDADNQQGFLQNLTYAKAANYACLAGNFAGLDDGGLAHSSYTLASELSPKSVNAWSRIGDAFIQEKSAEKAMFAYQTVLDIGDKALYAQQIANAQQHLADYYQRMEVPAKADTYRQASDQYYHSYGIVNPLTAEEAVTINIISAKQQENLPESLTKLLQQDQYTT